jgi:hypothetical protein
LIQIRKKEVTYSQFADDSICITLKIPRSETHFWQNRVQNQYIESVIFLGTTNEQIEKEINFIHNSFKKAKIPRNQPK